jgi:hypothetical protein
MVRRSYRPLPFNVHRPVAIRRTRCPRAGRGCAYNKWPRDTNSSRPLECMKLCSLNPSRRPDWGPSLDNSHRLRVRPFRARDARVSVYSASAVPPCDTRAHSCNAPVTIEAQRPLMLASANRPRKGVTPAAHGRLTVGSALATSTSNAPKFQVAVRRRPSATLHKSLLWGALVG